MKSFRSLVRDASVALVAASSLTLAGPMITIEKTSYDAGSIREGKMAAVTYEFKIKNTGDADLKITRVNPG